MSRILFIPIRVLGGFLAGKVATGAFARVWRMVDRREESPQPEQRGVPWPKLVLALVLEGAIFRASRGIFERGSRELFRRLTGSWPGEPEPGAQEG